MTIAVDYKQENEIFDSSTDEDGETHTSTQGTFTNMCKKPLVINVNLASLTSTNPTILDSAGTRFLQKLITTIPPKCE